MPGVSPAVGAGPDRGSSRVRFLSTREPGQEQQRGDDRKVAQHASASLVVEVLQATVAEKHEEGRGDHCRGDADRECPGLQRDQACSSQRKTCGGKYAECSGERSPPALPEQPGERPRVAGPNHACLQLDESRAL